MLNAKNIQKDFPIFANRKKNGPFIYLDTGATSQKPKTVIDAVSRFYETTNANIHRGIYKLADEATTAYEDVRTKVAKFLNASSSSEIVFTGNTNEAINLVATGWAKKFLQKGDVVVITDMEHHANVIPWQRLRDEIGIVLYFLPLDQDYRLDYQALLSANIDLKKVKLVSIVHGSNVLGTINPIGEIVAFLKKEGIQAKVLVDAAQTVPHMKIDVQMLNCDFLAFSSHKMLGPSGVGVLWAKKELLEVMDPLFVGSHMVGKVTKEKTDFADVPDKFEVGTGKLEAVVGLGAAISYLESIGMDAVENHDKKLVKHGLKLFQQEKDFTLYGPKTEDNRLAIFSFAINGIHPHDIAQILDQSGICVRSGNHCAQTLMSILGTFATTRASCYIYNEESDLTTLFKKLINAKKMLRV
ncbi:MAG: SufS family cysteine desulfurase [bacterium]